MPLPLISADKDRRSGVEKSGKSAAHCDNNVGTSTPQTSTVGRRHDESWLQEVTALSATTSTRSSACEHRSADLQ